MSKLSKIVNNNNCKSNIFKNTTGKYAQSQFSDLPTTELIYLLMLLLSFVLL